MSKVSFENITLDVEVGGRFTRKKDKIRVLDDISGVIQPHDFVALMGASGAGKSSLLNVLSGRNATANGKVLHDGRQPVPNISTSCFIQQEDMFHGFLTVEEHLNTQSRLRLPLSKIQCQQRVATLLKRFELEGCQHTKIGNFALGTSRGVSGGEQKRLSLATELLTNPRLIFADEPTSGLDSFMADAVVNLLKNLAKQGHTVIATIHQPSSDVFECFNKVLILSEGKMVYYGRRVDVVPYFSGLNFVCPPYTNVADYIIEILATDQPNAKQQLDCFVESWREKRDQWSTEESLKVSKSKDEEVDSFRVPLDETTGKSMAVPWLTIFGTLTKRQLIDLSRNPMVTRVRITQALFISIVSGCIFLRLKDWYSLAGSLYFMAIQMGFQSVADVVFSLSANVPIVQREMESGLYSSWTLYLATNLCDVPMQIILPLIFTTMAWWLMGFRDTFVAYVLGVAFSVITVFSATAYGYIASALGCRTKGVGNAIAPVLLVPMLMAHPFLVSLDSLPKFWLWLVYISPFKYGWSGQMYATFHHRQQDNCIPSPLQLCDGDEFNATYAVYADRLWTYVIIPVAIGIIGRFIGAVIFWRTLKKKANE